MSHPKVSLLKGSNFKILARVVELSPSSLYICVAQKSYLSAILAALRRLSIFRAFSLHCSEFWFDWPEV